jgi:hypothetical protein
MGVSCLRTTASTWTSRSPFFLEDREWDAKMLAGLDSNVVSLSPLAFQNSPIISDTIPDLITVHGPADL